MSFLISAGDSLVQIRDLIAKEEGTEYLDVCRADAGIPFQSSSMKHGDTDLARMVPITIATEARREPKLVEARHCAQCTFLSLFQSAPWCIVKN